MKFNQLTNLTVNKNKKRKGRGISAGQGKTAGRGTKGQNSRSGGGVRPFFEGGQMPLVRKLPKLRGFKSHRPKKIEIYTYQLNEIKTNSKVVDNYVLAQNNLIKDAYQSVKLIKKGEINSACELQIQAISAAAKADLIKAGGSFKKIKRMQQKTSDKKQQRKASRNVKTSIKKNKNTKDVVK